MRGCASTRRRRRSSSSTMSSRLAIQLTSRWQRASTDLDRPVAAGRAARHHVRHGLPPRPAVENDSRAAPDRRQRHLLQQPRCSRTSATTSSGQIQDRNKRRKRGLGEPHAHAEARGPGGARQQRPHRRCRLDQLRDDRQHRAGPDRARARLSAEGVDPQRPPLLPATRWTAPMLDFYRYLSARWQVKQRRRGKDIPIEVYYDAEASVQRRPHDPGDAEVARLLHGELHAVPAPPGAHPRVPALRAASRRASPTRFRSRSRSASSPTCATEDAIDYVFYVTAHEVAHQWWAHQVIGANVQGATMLVRIAGAVLRADGDGEGVRPRARCAAS